MNPTAIALQGLGLGTAMVAMQGLLEWGDQASQAADAYGGSAPRRKSRRATPQWLTQLPVEEEEALLMVGLL
jgi:hypothetical protein